MSIPLMDEATQCKIAEALGGWDPLIWLVTSHHHDVLGGLIATFLVPASIAPGRPRLLMGLGVQHRTHTLVTASQSAVAHLLPVDATQLVERFALHHGRPETKFADLAYTISKAGNPILRDASAWVEGVVSASMAIGDRTVFLLELIDGTRHVAAPDMKFSDLRNNGSDALLRQLDDLLDRDALRDFTTIGSWLENQENST